MGDVSFTPSRPVGDTETAVGFIVTTSGSSLHSAWFPCLFIQMGKLLYTCTSRWKELAFSNRFCPTGGRDSKSSLQMKRFDCSVEVMSNLQKCGCFFVSALQTWVVPCKRCPRPNHKDAAGVRQAKGDSLWCWLIMDSRARAGLAITDSQANRDSWIQLTKSKQNQRSPLKHIYP